MILFEQPTIISNLIQSQRVAIDSIIEKIRGRNIQYKFLANRGTSDNAGRCAQYLFGAVNKLPLALATPSLFSLYHQPLNLINCLEVGISQSGMSPDIIRVLEEGKRQGCPTLAITNNSNSPLAEISEYVIDIQSGVETAVAVTKSDTAELIAIAMVSASLSKLESMYSDLNKIPAWISKMLSMIDEISGMAERLFFKDSCVVLGRGYNYSTAFEWSLMLKGLSYIGAEPYLSADFLHGPIAIIEKGYPILSIVINGGVYQS